MGLPAQGKDCARNIKTTSVEDRTDDCSARQERRVREGREGVHGEIGKEGLMSMYNIAN